MPRPYWIHTCCDDKRSTASPLCDECGTAGLFAGWSLGMHEAMARFQYTYGLTPVGPHRQMASQLFENARSECEQCGGEGILSLDADAWRPCGACEGTGGLWRICDDAKEAIRRRIISEYPAAEASSNIAFLAGSLAQDLSTGRMVDMAPAALYLDNDVSPIPEVAWESELCRRYLVAVTYTNGGGPANCWFSHFYLASHTSKNCWVLWLLGDSADDIPDMPVAMCQRSGTAKKDAAKTLLRKYFQEHLRQHEVGRYTYVEVEDDRKRILSAEEVDAIADEVFGRE